MKTCTGPEGQPASAEVLSNSDDKACGYLRIMHAHCLAAGRQLALVNRLDVLSCCLVIGYLDAETGLTCI